MKKRVFALIAVMGLSIALMACSGGSKENADADESAKTSTAKPLVIEVEDKDDVDVEDDGEVLDGTAADNNMVDPETGENVPNEDWSDFEFKTVLVPEDEATEDCVEFDREYYEIFRLDFNHKDEVDRIEFYNLTNQDEVAKGKYSTDEKYDAYFADDDNYDLVNEPVFIKYSVPEVIPNLLIRVTSYGGIEKAYLVTYNGRDGGATTVDVTDEVTFTH